MTGILVNQLLVFMIGILVNKLLVFVQSATWTALISGPVENCYFSSGLLYFSKMRRENIHFTFPCAFKASAALCLPFTEKQIHAVAVKLGQINDKFVGCTAFDMYSKTGLKFEAKRLFDEMAERNIATWNAYFSNAVLDGNPRKAIDTFIDFHRVVGEPDSITFCAFLNVCADAGYLDFGRQLHGFVIRSGFEGDVSVAMGPFIFMGTVRKLDWLKYFQWDGEDSVSWCSMVLLVSRMMRRRRLAWCFWWVEGKGLSWQINWFQVSSAYVQGFQDLNWGGQFMHLQWKHAWRVMFLSGVPLLTCMENAEVVRIVSRPFMRCLKGIWFPGMLWLAGMHITGMLHGHHIVWRNAAWRGAELCNTELYVISL